MRHVLAAAALAGVFASPVAGQMLYVVTPPKNQVEGFCLGPNGGLDVNPTIIRPTVASPQRVLAANGVLYVAGRSRVESFRIGPAGGLEPIGKSDRIGSGRVLDLAIDEGRTRLYVPHPGQGRIEAHPLDPATGGLTGQPFTSCALTSGSGQLRDIEVSSASGSELLYASQTSSFFTNGKRGRVDVYELVGGELPDPADHPRCDPDVTTSTSTSTSSTTLTTTVTTSTTTSTIDEQVTPPTSARRKLRFPTAFVVNDDHIYVYDAAARKIIVFALANGQFTSDLQERESATGEIGGFEDLVGLSVGAGDPGLSPVTLVGSQNGRGRVRAFYPSPTDPGQLRKQPQRTTRQDIETTPVRLEIGGFCDCGVPGQSCDPRDPATVCLDEPQFVLYAPGGEAHRVDAYRFVVQEKKGEQGLVPETSPFSKSGFRQGTFPNAAAVAYGVACGPGSAAE
jgi:hypothetical protein